MTVQPLITKAEVADLLRVAPSTVDEWARQGLIGVVRLPSGRRRFRLEDVQKLISDGVEEAS